MTPETSDAGTTPPVSGPDNNVVFVGKKGVMDYVMAIMAQFSKGTSDVVVKARGHSISRAVDAVEATRNRYLPDMEVTEIKIGTEELEGKRGDMVNVSWIELFISGPGGNRAE
ncbi:MAG: DNA-binding protein Alba [Euryarchaeota archaeon]|nr:DNA-binding protein Alba [Euryarchaeota archaeon]